MVALVSPQSTSPRPPQPDWLAREAHPDFEFRADWHPLDERAEGVHQERVALVPAVEPDFLSEQARRHTDAHSLGRCRHHCSPTLRCRPSSRTCATCSRATCSGPSRRSAARAPRRDRACRRPPRRCPRTRSGRVRRVDTGRSARSRRPSRPLAIRTIRGSSWPGPSAGSRASTRSTIWRCAAFQSGSCVSARSSCLSV